MSVRLKRKPKSDEYRPDWYGRYRDHAGKLIEVNLGVKIRGTPPENLKESSDKAFERSRAKAEAKLDSIREEIQDRSNAEYLARKIYAGKTGSEIEDPPLTSLAEWWRRDGEATEQHFRNCDQIFRRFADWVATRGVTTCCQVTRPLVAAYEESLNDYAPKTRESHLKLLRYAFASYLPTGLVNPFAKRRNGRHRRSSGASNGEDGEVIHRKALSIVELEAIFEGAKKHDPELYPAVVCAAMTGLRKGDVMNLRWESVRGNVLSVQTRKTGSPVDIPILGPLQKVLDDCKGRDETFVFPKLQAIYDQAPYQLSRRLKKVVVFSSGALELPPKAGPELVSKALQFIGSEVPPSRRDKVRDCFLRYVDGQSLPTIAEEVGISKGSVSNYLHEVQAATGTFMRRTKKTSFQQAVRSTQMARTAGQRRGSRIDWHALRTSLVTICLSHGVPESTLRKITGHTNPEILLRHYDQQSVEHVRATLLKHLPVALTGVEDKES